MAYKNVYGSASYRVSPDFSEKFGVIANSLTFSLIGVISRFSEKSEIVNISTD